MTDERLDDTIDRVARELTAAPRDPALVARIAERVGASGPRRVEWWRILAPAAAVAAVVLFAAIVLQREARPPAAVTAPAVAAVPSEKPTTAPAESGAPASEPVTERASARPARRQAAPPFEPQIPQVEALSSPALLAVDTITEDELTIAPVGVASLDVANLALTDADRRDDPKE